MNDNTTPSKAWYLGHIFFWVITGFICYTVYKDTNKAMAKKHLIRSVWVPIAVWMPLFVILTLIFPDDISYE